MNLWYAVRTDNYALKVAYGSLWCEIVQLSDNATVFMQGDECTEFIESLDCIESDSIRDSILSEYFS
jgi:hypothetical protein